MRFVVFFYVKIQSWIGICFLKNKKMHSFHLDTPSVLPILFLYKYVLM